MIKVLAGTCLSKAIICVETRSTLEDEHIIYTLDNGYEIEITGPATANAVFKVAVYKNSKLLTISDRVGKEQLITHLDLAATCK